MSFRPKTKRRLTQLAGGGLVVAGLAAAGVTYQLRRHEAARQRLRAEGMTAFDHGDYVRTLIELTKYLSDNRTDPEAIKALAIARTRVARPEQAHLVAARGLLVRYLELRPDDVEAQHLLLDLYQRLGYRYETDALADGLLAHNPADTAALAAKWQSLYRQDRLDQALGFALRLDQVDPTDVRSQEATLELMARLHRPPGELVARADRLLADHRADPRFELVRAVAAHLAGDDADTRQWLAAAAGRPSPDPRFTLTLAAAFDRIGQWSDAIAVLAKAGPAAPPAVRAALVERLWYAGDTTDALARLGDVAPSDPKSDLALIGLKGLLLDGAAGPTDALVAPITAPAGVPPTTQPIDGIRTFLSVRSSDPVAAGWSALLRVSDPAHPLAARQAVALASAAARNDPENPAARFFLGRAYLRFGEPGLAMQTLAGASVLAPSWAAPQVLLARALLDAGQPTAALAPARAAAARDPSSVAARTVLAVIAYRTLPPRATADQLNTVLSQVRAAVAADPADARLPAAEVDLLVRTGHRSDAVAAATGALTGAGAARLYRVAAVAAADRLDVSAAVLARAGAVTPASADEAFDLAMAFAAVGQADRGRQVFARAPQDDATAAWQVADLRYREATAPSPTLTDAWAALAAANPDDVVVQRATLASPAAGRSRPLIDKTIDRLRAATGDEAVEWRLARARFQLADADGRPIGKDAANAVSSSMAEVSRTVPHLAEPLLLRATALEQLGDLPGAIARLRSAVPLAPDDPSVSLRLAHLLLRTGQFGAATEAIDPLAAHPADLPPAVATDVADVCRQAGDEAKAVAVLRQAGGASDAAQAVPLAQAQAAAGDLRGAADTFDRVNRSTPTVDSLRAAAWFYGANGNIDRARRLLDQLGTMTAVTRAQQDVIRGQFAAAFGDPARARSQLGAATRASPDDPRPWAALAGFELHAGNATAAVDAANHGVALAPSDGALSALRDRAQTVAALRLPPAAQPLLDALAVDPTNPDAVATLDALAGGSPASLSAVAAKDPAFFPAQALVADRLVTAGQYDEAAAVATRAAAAAPSDPAPERLLLSIWTTAGRPDAALAAAEQWRARSLADPQSADAAVATASIRLGDPGRAVGLLGAYVRDGTATPATTEAYARALAASGRAEEADGLLKPLATGSSPWRQAWLSIIADTAPSVADGTARVARVEPLLAAGSVDDRVAVAGAWFTLGSRFDDAAALRRGLDELDPLSDVSSVPTDALLLTGALHQQLNELPEAEEAYRKALAANPALPRAMNNLAWVIVLRNGDLSESRRLAERAVALLPGNADVRTTLGQVALKQGDVPTAAEAFRTATRLSPRSAAAWAGLADAEARAGHTGDAAGALGRAEQLLAPPAPRPSSATTAELQRARAALGRPAQGGPRTVRPVG